MGTQLTVSSASDIEGLARLADDARGYAAASRAQSTRRAYMTDWEDFTAWCSDHGAEALPASPATVALYLTDRAASLRPSTLTRRAAAISVLHQEQGHESPTRNLVVQRVLSGIRRTHGGHTKQARPAGIGEVRRMVAHLPDTLSGRRDRALLLVGFAGALRRSELVGLNVGDLEARDEGYSVVIRRSKTDQAGAGRRFALPMGADEQTCPVRALDAWLAEAEIERGAIFRGVDRHGNVSANRLSARSVHSIVRRAAVGAGLDPEGFSGHSLRAGFCTTAAANGASERQIAHQSGHKSIEVLRGYVRHGGVFVDNAATMVGL